MIEDYIRRAVERAIHEAEHPRGMGIHDGKARIEASYLRRMLAMLDAAPTPPAQDDYPPRMKREDDCMTLQDWRIRAMNLEASWANCSQACARIQGQRDEALEVLRSLVMAIERRQSLAGSPAWKQAHDTVMDAMERARALLITRGAA